MGGGGSRVVPEPHGPAVSDRRGGVGAQRQRGPQPHAAAAGRRKSEDAAAGRVWAAHAGQEIANWAGFLPDLHRLYRVVTDPRRNPFTDLRVTGQGRQARYAAMA